MIFNIKINEDKTVEYDEIVVNQFENKIDSLEFVLPFDDCSYVGVFKSPNNKKLEIPVINNKIIIDKNITSIAGTWNLIIVANKEDTTFISNPILLESCRNYLNLKTMQEIDTNISFLYKEIQETLSKLNDTGLNEISFVVLELKEINNNLQSLSNKIESIQIKDYAGEFAEIKNLLTDAGSIADVIKGE